MTSYITRDQLDEVWERRGMKFRCSRLHDYMVSHGLGPMAVRKDLFLDEIKRIMDRFMIQGLVEDKNGGQRFPGDVTDRDSKEA